MNPVKCAFVPCYNPAIGITMKQITDNTYADIPTCAYNNHWLFLRLLTEKEDLEHFFSFQTKRLRKKKELEK